ncbi:MAG: hypothetical protein L0J23_05430 [Bifidobacterium crudilactis]|nr:hypothetical protein [Bifidobacterium crudilactis]
MTVAAASIDGGTKEDPKPQNPQAPQNPSQEAAGKTQGADAAKTSAEAGAKAAAKRNLATTGADVSQAGLIVLALFMAWGACALSVKALRQRDGTL